MDKLRDDFVTYQAIRRSLREWRGAEDERLSDAEKVEEDRESIQRRLSRTLSMTEDRIDLGAFKAVVETRVNRRECGIQRTVQKPLDNGEYDRRRKDSDAVGQGRSSEREL